MIGRLFRYELKCGSIVFPLSWAVIAILFLFIKLAEKLELFVVLGFLSLSIVLVAIGSMLYAVIFPVLRYYKSMFGKEAYLIQTLPVSKGKLLFSKLAFAGMCYLAGLITVALVFVLTRLFEGNIFEIFSGILGGRSALLWYFGISVIIQSFQTINLLYFAITLANTSRFIKNNIAFSVLFYLVGNFVAGIINVIAMLFIPLVLQITPTSSQIAFKFYSMELHNINNYNIVLGLGPMVTMLLISMILVVLTEKLLRTKASVK